jgi:hypothetical protein
MVDVVNVLLIESKQCVQVGLRVLVTERSWFLLSQLRLFCDEVL